MTALLTPEWTPLFYHPEQSRLLTSPARFKAVCAGRGSGKTEYARRYLVMKALEKKPWPDPKYFFVGPTADQAEKLGWDKLLALIPPSLIVGKPHQNKKIITLWNGAKIYVCSGQKPERLEGVQWDGGVIDESSDEPPGIFTKNLGPAMTHRRAWCWRIGVPKRRGIGAKEFRTFYELGVSGTDPEVASFHWMSKDILSPEQLDYWKSRMSPQDFREQYEASWEITTGLAFPDFSKENIDDNITYSPSQWIIVGSDFNVDPMAWALFHYVNGELLQFDEIWLRGTTTQKTLDHLWEKYQHHKSGWVFVGDASSRARKTSASSTDYLQIYNDQRFQKAGRKIFYPKSNPAIADRLATMNGAILNAQGQRRYRVHPSCVKSISDLESRHYKEPQEDKPNPKGALNDIGDLGHITDAIGYTICRFLPMEIGFQPPSKVILGAK